MLVPHYKIAADVGACPWCGARMKHAALFPLPMIFKCGCGGMWVLTTPPEGCLPVPLEPKCDSQL